MWSISIPSIAGREVRISRIARKSCLVSREAATTLWMHDNISVIDPTAI